MNTPSRTSVKPSDDAMAHALKVIEFHDFLHVLSGYAASPAGMAKLRALRPLRRPPKKWLLREPVNDLLELRQKEVLIPAPSVEDLGPYLKEIQPIGAISTPEDLLQVRDFLQKVADIKRFTQSAEAANRASLSRLNDKLDACPSLTRALKRVFGPRGDILDRASDELARLRAEIHKLRRHINVRLEALLGDSDYSDVFQDNYVAVRNNRYVIPVRREHKGRVTGIVHDQSNSGNTLFIEPTGLTESGNELTSLRVAEQDEIRKILLLLSDQVREATEALTTDMTELCKFDVARAISAWADDYRCLFPSFGQQLQLRNARHPLLARQFRLEQQENRLVPLNLTVPPEAKVVVITGSNTGGKTVMLKTIGLLTAIAQCGLPIPADPRSSVRFFPALAADIGDEQSIQHNLSTFSGHMHQIGTILSTAERKAQLVLLDELGSGTDPVEGGALSCAILEALARADGLCIATTHLGMIKRYVHEHDQMLNASVRFNQETLAPDYVLELGRPGASYAFAIAERWNLPADVLTNGRAMLDPAHVALNDMLANMADEQQELTSNLADSRTEVEQLRKQRKELQEQLAQLRRDRRDALHKANQEAVAIVDNTRKQMERLLNKAGKLSSPQEATQKEEAAQLREQLKAKKANLQGAAAETKPKPKRPVGVQNVQVGDRVWVEVLQDCGSVVSIQGDRTTVEIGGMEFQVDSKELGQPPKEVPAPTAAVNIHTPRLERAVAPELNLVGKRVDDALNQLEQYMSDVMLGGLPQVRIVHGRGTGRLRDAVHEYLRTCSVVAKFKLGRFGETTGGAGVTIVDMDQG